MSSVLYDAPGPRARARNNILTVVFAVVIIGVVVLGVLGLKSKGVFTAAQWSPFIEGQTWTTYILPGLGRTLVAAFLAMVIALPIGAALGIARMSDHVWLRGPAAVIVEFFRAIPVLLLMVFAWEAYFQFTTVSVDSIPLLAVVTGLVLYNGSVLAEVFRSGILALPRGQGEAGMAIGLRKSQITLSILLPQAVTSMLPVIVSQLVVVLKDTALGGLLIIGYAELLRTADGIRSVYANTVPAYIVIAAIYILLNLGVSSLATVAERRSRRAGRPGPAAPALPGGLAPGQAPNAGVAPDLQTGRGV